MFTFTHQPASRTLRFMHIPKTAGTTLVHILRAQYRFAARFEFSGDAEQDAYRYASLGPRERQRIALFAGHAPLRTGIAAADQCALITLLREPVARVQSFCRHVSEGKSPYLLARFPPDRFDLDDFLWSGNEELRNLQTKMLLNTRHCEQPWSASLTDAQAVDAALHTLQEKVTLYGIQEHFHESMLRFAAFFGWRSLRYSMRNRARGGRNLVFQPHHLQRIAELNAVDIELYRRAAMQFESANGRMAHPVGGWARAAGVLAHLFG